MPKIPASAWRDHKAASHPVSGQTDGPYSEMPLGDLVGLTQYGVHLERLPPGSRSSHRHWHEGEDEFVYLLSGELVLIEEGEVVLVAGEAAGWKAGQPVAHCFENRSDRVAVMLVVGTRLAEDVIHYPDHDMILHRGGEWPELHPRRRDPDCPGGLRAGNENTPERAPGRGKSDR